jgi:hypothetical protein
MQRHLLAAAAALSLALITPVGAQAQTVTLQPGQDHLLQPSDPSLPPVAITVLPTQQRAQFSMLPGVSCQGLGDQALEAVLISDSGYCQLHGLNSFHIHYNATLVGLEGARARTRQLSQATIDAAGGIFPIIQHDLTSTWETSTMDLTTGALTSIKIKGGYMWDSKRSSMGTGGSIRESQIILDASQRSISSNFEGNRYAVGTRPAMIYKQNGIATWRFDTWSGPLLPLNQLSGKSSDNILVTLQKAGFSARMTIDRNIIATAVYKTKGLALSADGVNLYMQSIGLNNSARGAFPGNYQKGLEFDPIEQANMAELSATVSILIRTNQ